MPVALASGRSGRGADRRRRRALGGDRAGWVVPRSTVDRVQTFDDVARLTAELPEVTEGVEKHRGHRTWGVGDKAFAWERPFSKADINRYGDQTPPDGPILAIRTAALAEKEAIPAGGQCAVSTIPHLTGDSACLVQLDRVSAEALREALIDGWLACAPSALADSYAEGSSS